METKIIAVAMAKGGQGKTSTALHLAHGIASKAKNNKVLLIDLDNQGSLTKWLLGPNRSNQETTIFETLTSKSKTPWNIVEINDNLDLIPADLSLAGIDSYLIGEMKREYVLKRKLEELQSIKKYEYILLDLSPSTSILTINALAAAQYVLIPMETKPLNIDGFPNINSVINEIIESEVNGDLKYAGILLTRFDKRTSSNKQVVEYMNNAYPDLVYKTVIRNNIDLADCTAVNQTVYDFAPKSNGAKDYKAFTNEFLKRIKSN